MIYRLATALVGLSLLAFSAYGQLIDPNRGCQVQPNGGCTPLPPAGRTPWYSGPLPAQPGPYWDYRPQQPAPVQGNYMFCYSRGPVAGTRNMFVSNVFESNSGTSDEAGLFERFTASQATPVYFSCTEGTDFVTMQRLVQQKIISLANQGYSISQLTHR